MGKQIVIIVVIFLVFVGIYIVFFQIFKKKSDEVMRILYIDQNIENYHLWLKNPVVKIMLDKKQKALLDIQEYQITHDSKKLEEKFAYLDHSQLPTGQKWMLLQNEISYYASINNCDKAEDTYTRMKSSVGEHAGSAEKGMLKEADYIINVDMKENISYLDQMLENIDQIDVPQSKGIFQLRAAKLFRKKGDTVNFQKYLSEAKENLKDTLFMTEITSLEK